MLGVAAASGALLGGASRDEDVLLALAGIELAAAAVHDAVLSTGLLDPAATAMVTSFAEHHRAHAAAYVERRTDLGSEEVEPEADADALESLIAPVFGAVDANALLLGALAIEEAMVATAVDACAQLEGQSVAGLAARVAAVEARHQAAVYAALGSTDVPAAGADNSLLDA